MSRIERLERRVYSSAEPRENEPRKKIVIIGAGKMGGVIATQLLERGVFRRREVLVTGRDSRKLEALAAKGAAVEADNARAAAASDIVILAVKPKDMRRVCTEIGEAARGRLVISIAAGIRLGSIGDWLDPKKLGPRRLARAMPNIAAAVGQGFTALTGYRTFSGFSGPCLVSAVFSSLGRYAWVDETQMDAITALSGSGPAFLFRLARVMEEIGQAHGLDAWVARLVAAQTLLGAGKILRTDAADIDRLVGQVATPGGTTMAGLEKAAELGLEDTFRKVIEAAIARSKELGGERTD